MKRIFFFLIIGAAFLTGCGEDDNVTGPVPSTNPSKEQLTAKWKMVKGEIYQNGKLVYSEDLKSEDCEYSYYDLKSNGSKDEVYFDPEDSCAMDNTPGTWTYDHNKKLITMTDTEDGYRMQVEIVTLTSTEFKFKLVKEGDDDIPEGTEIYGYLKK